MDPEVAKFLGAAISMGIGSMGPGIGVGFIGGKAMEAMGRNPQMADKIYTIIIVDSAITESTGIYALVVALILLFVA